MTSGTLEADFERWRRERDLDALAAVFDAMAPELLRVARHLVRNEAAAEDLVQATFLVVLEQPGRFAAGACLVSWLVGILTNLAKKHWRSAARSIDPERAARRPEPGPAERLAGAELAAALHTALDQLREPYASVVRAHLLDGARPTDLAQRLAIAPGTVRMQLKRGLSQLRQALPVGLAVPLVVARAQALERLRDTVLARAAALRVAGASASWLGILLMHKALVGASLAALAAFAFLAFLLDRAPAIPTGSIPDRDGRVSSATAASSPAPKAATKLALPMVQALEAGDAAPPREVATSQAQPGIWLIGTVARSRQSGDAPAILDVSIWGDGKKVRAEASADGTYAIDLLPLLRTTPPGQPLGSYVPMAGTRRASEPQRLSGQRLLHIVASHEFCMPRTATPTLDLGGGALVARHELRQDFLLVPASVIAGTVLGATAPERATVALFAGAALAGRVAEPNAAVEVDEHGQFELRSEVAGPVELWAFHSQRRPRIERTTAALGRRTDVGVIRLDHSGVELTGQLDLPGELLSGAQLVAERDPPAGRDLLLTTFQGLARSEGRLLDTLRSTRADEHGAFQLRGLDAGPWRLRLASLEQVQLCPRDAGRVVEPPAAGIVIGDDRRLLRAEVHSTAGPVPHATVTVTTGSESIEVPTNERGEVLWLGAAVDYRLEVEAAGFRREAIVLAASEHERTAMRRIELTPAATAALELAIDDASEQVASHVLVTLHDAADGPAKAEHRAAIAGGIVRVEALPSGPFLVRVRPLPANEFVPPVAGPPTAQVEFAVDLRAGELTKVRVTRPAAGRLHIDARFELPPEQSRGRVEIRDERGRRIATTTVIDQPHGWLEGHGVFDCRGANTIRPDLPQGRYTVVVEHASLGMLRREVEIVAGRTTTIRLER